NETEILRGNIAGGDQLCQIVRKVQAGVKARTVMQAESSSPLCPPDTAQKIDSGIRKEAFIHKKFADPFALLVGCTVERSEYLAELIPRQIGPPHCAAAAIHRKDDVLGKGCRMRGEIIKGAGIGEESAQAARGGNLRSCCSHCDGIVTIL